MQKQGPCACIIQYYNTRLLLHKINIKQDFTVDDVELIFNYFLWDCANVTLLVISNQYETIKEN